MQRPTSATVLGILNLIFAALGLCGVGFAVIALAVIRNADAAGGRLPLSLKLMQNNEIYRLFNIASIGLGGIFAVLLAVAGIGLLRVRPWGRTLSIVYGVYGVLMSIATVTINLAMFAPELKLAQQAADVQGTAEAMSGMIGAGVNGCFGLIYPIALLGFMLFHSPLREAFGAGRHQPDTMDIPDDVAYPDQRP